MTNISLEYILSSCKLNFKICRVNLQRRLVSWCWLVFSLWPAPADEANNDKNVEHEVDDDRVVDETVNFNRPDVNQRQDALHSSI